MNSRDWTGPAERLESLWQGAFGDDYTERNAVASEGRAAFWKEFLAAYTAQRILEVGCNMGANLRWIASLVPPREVYGLDVNEHALARLRELLPGVNALWGKARELPFRDDYFDLVFTSGVLIHQPPEALAEVMSEIVRCSRRYVLAAEYYSERLTEVPYRGQAGALFKADFGTLYQEQHPGLKILSKGFLSRAHGWDDVTYWVLEKSR